MLGRWTMKNQKSEIRGRRTEGPEVGSPVFALRAMPRKQRSEVRNLKQEDELSALCRLPSDFIRPSSERSGLPSSIGNKSAAVLQPNAAVCALSEAVFPLPSGIRVDFGKMRFNLNYEQVPISDIAVLFYSKCKNRRVIL